MTRIELPAGVDGGRILRPLNTPTWQVRGPGGAAYRRRVTRESPIRFALTYLPHALRHRHTDTIALSELHLALAAEARTWIEPRERRSAWVAPRRAGKTMWLFLILPLWALAHGHRRFFLAFALNAEQAEGHLANLRAELAGNDLLLHDFPELVRRTGPGASDTKRTVTASGATIAARGLGGTALGIRSGVDRPDLILGDDLQPQPGKHTPERKASIEQDLTSSILPMGDETTVTVVAGTTTMYGCLMHDVVRASLPEGDPDRRVAPWIAAHGFTCHYWPAVLDAGTERERSIWPQRWSLRELAEWRERAPQDYALNMANRPEEAGALGWWRRELIRYDAHVSIVRRVLYADVAMTQRARSDQTALVLLGISADGRTAVVEHSFLGRIEGRELRDLMWEWTDWYPKTLHEWIVEGNQGGDRWREILAPTPPGVRLDVEHVTGSKRSRIEAAVAHYQRRAVVHSQPQPDLEAQMLAWTPAAKADDGLDALAGALRRVFPGQRAVM